MGRAWFKPKRTGYGCVPSTREGWLVTIGYVVLLLGVEAALFLAGPTTPRIVGFLIYASVC